MKKLLIVALLCAGFALVPVLADDARGNERSVAPPAARYEVVQSPIGVRWTFRLDRVTGKTWLCVLSGEVLTWEPMEITGLPFSPSNSAPHFQIFESALGARYTFLEDTLTGAVWIYTTGGKGEEEKRSWMPMGGAPIAPDTAILSLAAPPKPVEGEPKKPKLDDFATWAEYDAANDRYVKDLVRFEAKRAVTQDRADAKDRIAADAKRALEKAKAAK